MSKLKFILQKTIFEKISFTTRHGRISRKNLSSKIKVKKVRTLDARNKNGGIPSMNQLNQLKKISNKKE